MVRQITSLTFSKTSHHVLKKLSFTFFENCIENLDCQLKISWGIWKKVYLIKKKI